MSFVVYNIYQELVICTSIGIIDLCVYDEHSKCVRFI